MECDEEVERGSVEGQDRSFFSKEKGNLENKSCDEEETDAFYDRKLLDAAQELDRDGIDRLITWFKRMDNKNRGFLSYKNIVMAISESGATLSESELRSITSGMQHNEQKELHYKELVRVMYRMINGDSDSDSCVSGDDLADVLNGRGTMTSDREDILSSVRSQCMELFSVNEVPKMVRRAFHKRDPDTGGTMSVSTFLEALDEIGLVLQPQQVLRNITTILLKL